jgi:hypothetical protein
VATYKTSNIGLNTWAATDYFKRVEFNENFEKIDDKIGILFKKGNFISIKEYENLKVAIAEGYDWYPAISQAISDSNTTKKTIILHADEDMYITQPIKPNVSTKIVGFGKFNSIIKLKGAIVGIDLSDANAKTGIEISSIAIIGDNTPGQIGIDANYLTNGSTIRDIRIENVDIGIRVKKCWYGAFSEIFIRNCLNYGMHIISASSTEQVNAISFKSIFIQYALNCVFLDGVNVSAAIKFDSCTFEQSKKTAVVANGFSPLTFDNCYFESNYTDATTTDALSWTTPIDVKVTGTTVRNVVKFTGCYFARKNNFLASTQKTSVYLGSNIKAVFESCQFACNTSNYIDSNIYSDSQYAADIRKCSEDGYAKVMYTGVQKEEIIAVDKQYNLRYTSTLDTAYGVILRDGDYYIKFIPHTTGTVAEQVTVKLELISDGTQLGATVIFPTTFTKDTPIEFKVGYVSAPKAVQLKAYTNTTTDLNGTIYLVRKHND